MSKRTIIEYVMLASYFIAIVGIPLHLITGNKIAGLVAYSALMVSTIIQIVRAIRGKRQNYEKTDH